MFGGDLYSPPDGDFSLSRSVLELFVKYGIAFDMLTKAGIKAAKDFELYRSEDSFGVTLTFLNPEKSKTWEPGAALPEERIASLKAAKEKGIKTWASCEPVLDPEETLAVIEAAAPCLDFVWIGKLNAKGKKLPDYVKELEHQIDWHKFKAEAVALVERLGIPYELKYDLLKATSGPLQVVAR